jgi:hypothetical protein
MVGPMRAGGAEDVRGEPGRMGGGRPRARGGQGPGGRPGGGLSLGAWALGTVAVAVVAAVPGSPFQPLQPGGTRPGGPFRWLAGALGVDALRGEALVALGVGAVVLAVLGFLLALRAAWRGEVGTRGVLGLSVLAHLAVLTLPLLFSRDVYSYGMYGRIAGVHGANPYVAVPADFPADPLAGLVGPRWIGTPAVYGPLFTLISAGIARAVGSVEGLVLAFRAAAVAASLATAVAATALARRVRPERAAFAAAAFGLNPVVLFQSAGSGHNDLLVALAVALAALLVLGGRALPATAVLALGAGVKATAAVPLLLLAAWEEGRRPAGRRSRALAAHLGLAAAVWLAAALPFLQARDPSLGMLELATHEGWLAPSRLVRRTLGALAGAVGGGALEGAVGTVVRVAFAAALLLGLALLVVGAARRAPGRGPREAVAAWGWGLLLLMLLGPVLLPWYVTWALPLVALLPPAGRRALLGTSVALALSQFAAEPARFPRAYDANLLFGHYVVTPVVAALLVLLLRDLRRRLREAAPLDDAPEQLPAQADRR